MKRSEITTLILFLISSIVPPHGYGFNGIQMGGIFQIKNNHYVPVFNDDVINLTYRSGPRGSCCHNLDIVLLPLSTIQIIEIGKNENIEIEYCVSETVRGRGFIHANFIRNSMIPVRGEFWKVALQKKRYPGSLQEFRKACYRCISEKTPYCAGASNFDRIDLNEMYSLSEEKSNSSQNEEYKLYGFDGFGFLYFVSNGVLGREFENLGMMGEKLFVFDTKKEYSSREKKSVLRLMRDSDYIFIRHKKKGSNRRLWYVVISFNGGFLEFKGKKHGIVFVEKESALKRLDTLLRRAKLYGSDLYVMRWHPELRALLEPRESILDRKMPLR
ncbi:MAG: hypothetical protein LBC30_04290 [Puniceicoccales bacterium]|jgi:hypothetical protein|nr:hypothetical protein [Puniceicoccales bacterium]